jgi:RNA polymerase sporulation-specific sigma factor
MRKDLKSNREHDARLVLRAKNGQQSAYDQLVRSYFGFVRLKANHYFLAGGEHQDLIQEGLVGFFKAVRDFRPDRDASFRNFAEICITRQIITAVKTANRGKHQPLNQSISFSQSPPSSDDDGHASETLEEALPGPSARDPLNQVISSEELRALLTCISTALSELESRSLALYLDGQTYQEAALQLGRDTKAVDNALHRAKRKLGRHLTERQLLDAA